VNLVNSMRGIRSSANRLKAKLIKEFNQQAAAYGGITVTPVDHDGH
jgi:hypothetical protein